MVGRLGLRPLQDRHRPEQLAHRRADARRAAVRAAAGARRPARRARQRVQRAALRLARRHRQGPRQRQGGAARPGRASSPTRSTSTPSRRCCTRSAPSAACALLGTHAGRLRREDRPRLPPPRDAALPRQRHALHRLRRGRRASSPSAQLLLGRRRLRRQRRGGRPTARRHKVIAPDTTVLPLPVPQRRRAAGADRTRTAASIAELMRRNERHWRSDAEIDAGLLNASGA